MQVPKDGVQTVDAVISVLIYFLSCYIFISVVSLNCKYALQVNQLQSQLSEW